ncbi:Phosphatidylinositol:ceramide phosphoinositol transferase (IPC synthase) [Wickerhamomyces ciferrii]|uniref:Phosphatidylinositol:ceramide phosphoinositol transferase (IPC synthase) n=1 Tax=Wickerhamomyces ciferrii (strain ATCC 14091 / BCRC 22168 / CBS 111 / JCM 3599 / NBRC 0793 / NRRL Y-1031 F-60-10) TaxID=1206466 RepID=K0KFS5_WICCF|nr:Phosphatidylinositol:ceramide phosphoinositol transferase (IPC synthase) [Wickerhamomyces ciferrii]CCH44010.1 Phosphatidylinositol:ceramide phosphoinositol transferase (IPC synthase) [Wickerhamomyces ciferrii]
MSFLIKLFQSYFLDERPNGAVIADIDLNLNPKITVERLKNHKFTKYEVLNYSTLAFFFTISFFLNQLNIFIKLGIVSLYITSLLIPFTSQFFIYGSPVLAWVAFLFNSKNLDAAFRPPISVKVLPAIETILYGDNLSQLLATSTAPILDILAWLPYGLIHFSFPFVTAALIFLWGPPTALRSFGFAFGYMNLIGVVTQVLFPAAAPWYKILHGLDPANYSMLGSPGGLARIDEILGFDMYTTAFSKTSPVVFGAFPSLHSGSASMDALFLFWLFPKASPIILLYVIWLWWSTMYLTHHYFFDLIAGSFLSFVVFQFTKYNYLPVINYNYKNRWSYGSIIKPNIWNSDPLSLSPEIDVENQVFSSQRAINNVELNVIQRQSRSNIFDDSEITSPALSVFENDSEVPRSFSRASNNSQTSIESQFDMSIPVSASSNLQPGGKSRLD